MSSGALIAARQKVLKSALRVITSEIAGNDDWAHADDENAYAWEQLALASRELTEATNALERSQQPVGWPK